MPSASLAQLTLPENVHVVDFGIRSYDLAVRADGRLELVILVDAISRGEAPGTVYTIQPDLPTTPDVPAPFDAHTMNPVTPLQLVSTLGGKAGRVLVVGCEPSERGCR